MKIILSSIALFSALYGASAQALTELQACTQVNLWFQGDNWKEDSPYNSFPYSVVVRNPGPLPFVPNSLEVNIELDFEDCDLEINKVTFDISCETCDPANFEPCRPQDNPKDFDGDCEIDRRSTERKFPYFVYGDSPTTGFVAGRYLNPGLYSVEWYINGDDSNPEFAQFIIN